MGSILEIVSFPAFASSSVLAKTFLFVIKSTLIFISFDSQLVNLENLLSLEIASIVLLIISSAREFSISLIFQEAHLISQLRKIVTKQLHLEFNNSLFFISISETLGTLILVR
jgi:hypothetical protein